MAEKSIKARKTATAAATTDLTEVAKTAVKKRKRPDVSEMRTEHTEPGDNRAYIEHSLRLFNLPKVDIKCPDDVRQRITEYFSVCAEDDMKPSVAGLAVALKVDRRRLWEIREGKRGEPSPEVAELLKQVVGLLDLQMVDYMQNGKINPVSGIFLMKNNFGYTDKQEVVLTPNNPIGDAAAQKELADKYLDIVDVGEE